MGFDSCSKHIRKLPGKLIEDFLLLLRFLTSLNQRSEDIFSCLLSFSVVANEDPTALMLSIRQSHIENIF